MDFEIFKYILINTGSSCESREKFLFELLAFPRLYFTKFNIENLLALIKKDLNKKISEDILTSFYRHQYKYEEYKYLIRENSFLMELLQSLNKINYIPYIFFNLKTKNISQQKDCVKILMNKERNLKKFLEINLDNEEEYFCVNIQFYYGIIQWI